MIHLYKTLVSTFMICIILLHKKLVSNSKRHGPARSKAHSPNQNWAPPIHTRWGTLRQHMPALCIARVHMYACDKHQASPMYACDKPYVSILPATATKAAQDAWSSSACEAQGSWSNTCKSANL
jgi:hypothetical protein